MNRNDRLTIDRETGDLFCEIERAQKLLSFVLVQQFPGKYGPEMMETMLEFVNDRLHFVLVRYNMIMGHNDRIGEEYYICYPPALIRISSLDSRMTPAR